MDSDSLRQQHPRFIFRSAHHEYQNTQLTFMAEFELEPTATFFPRVTINNITPETYARLDTKTLDHYAFLLGLVEIPSYWKTSCSPEIVIEAGSLTTDLQKYLYDLFLYGLSEFYFVNNITQFNEPDWVTITSPHPILTHTPITQIHHQESPLEKVLLPLGGGKDSLVALAALKQHGLTHDQLGILVLEPASPAAALLAKQSGIPYITAERTIDPTLKALNAQGYLNGHTPFSAYLSVLSSCVGHIFGYSHVALANERSANEGNINFHGLEVNHQWSKSFAYEQLFQELHHTDLPAGAPFYFSLLRPLYELQIAQLFAHFYQGNPEALTTFRSCNRGQQKNVWCGECPKCLFAYLILAPFMELSELLLIFGQDILNKPGMIPVAHDLLGKGSNKPLECVGMYEESVLAAYLTIERHYAQVMADQLPVVLKEIHHKILSAENNLAERAEQFLSGWNQENAVPTALATTMLRQLESSE